MILSFLLRCHAREDVPTKILKFLIFSQKQKAKKIEFLFLEAGKHTKSAGLYYNTSAMHSHLKRIHKIKVETIPRSSDPERFKCTHCGKVFKKSRTLKDHINTHTGRYFELFLLQLARLNIWQC